MRRVGFWAMLALSVGVIVTATLLPSGFRGGEQRHVSPLCLTCPDSWLADVISNVALFFPLGVSLTAVGLRARRAIALSSAFSVTIELLQFFDVPPGRTASFSDWCTNTSGAALGVLFVAMWPLMVRPSRDAAHRLLAGWTALTLAALGGSAWAVARDGPSAGHSAVIAASALPHTPGYGWFGGVTEVLSLNGARVAHRGSGPIMLHVQRTDRVTIETVERGRDDGFSTVPIAWLHAESDSLPHTLLAQRDRDLSLQARLNATRIGLATPRLVLRGVFPASRFDTTSLTRIRATVVNGKLSLSAVPAADSTSVLNASLSLSAALGWTLIQSVVHIDSRLGPWLSLVWLLLWFVPVGRWMVSSKFGRTFAQDGTAHGADLSAPLLLALTWSSLVLVTIGAAGVVFGVSPLAWWQDGACIGACMITAVVASSIDSRQKVLL